MGLVSGSSFAPPQIMRRLLAWALRDALRRSTRGNAWWYLYAGALVLLRIVLRATTRRNRNI